MIDVTATMLPSTIMNDRSLLARIWASAVRMTSANRIRTGYALGCKVI